MRLEKIERDVELSSLHRILLTTDGSITTVLEALFGEVSVETEFQKEVEAGSRLAEQLGVGPKARVNLRAVTLKAGEKALVYAISLTPMERIEPEFREEIMKEDIPIGRILRKLKIEYRREIGSCSAIEAKGKLLEVFAIVEGETLLMRKYKIVRKGEVMMKITEFFPYGLFKGKTA